MGEFTDTTELRKAIARAVLDDLEDRRSIKSVLSDIECSFPETYAEIEVAIAERVMAVLGAPPAAAAPAKFIQLSSVPNGIDGDGQSGHADLVALDKTGRVWWFQGTLWKGPPGVWLPVPMEREEVASG